MKETLHIFKKDLRRHWPEIVVSLILLGFYARYSLRSSPDNTAYVGFPLWRVSQEMIRPALILFWIFLTVRLVQGETLVGDRQWWVTKPYEWWKLLLAKELFLLFCVCVPLFLVQLFLLVHAGFPVLPNLAGLLNLQLGLGLFLFLPSLALGSLTKNLGQALLGVAAAFLTFTGGMWLLSNIPNSSMSFAAETSQALQGWLSMGSIIGAAGWQYARRRTWTSRGILLGGFGAIALIGVVTPYETFVERKYPLVEGSQAPVQFVARAVPRNTKVKGLWGSSPEAYLTIPLNVSGIVSGNVVVLEGIKATIETPEGVRLDPGWFAQSSELWADDDRRDFLYQMKRKEFEKIRTEVVRVHLELALTEYQPGEARELVLQEGKFPDPELGICRLQNSTFSQLECRRPFRAPGLIATFDPAAAQCAAEETDYSMPEDKVSHAWYAPSNEDGPQLGLNPVLDYPIAFASRASLFPFAPGRKVRVAYVCPGAKVRLAKPEEKRHVRVKVELEGVRLLDLITREGMD